MLASLLLSNSGSSLEIFYDNAIFYIQKLQCITLVMKTLVVSNMLRMLFEGSGKYNNKI